MQLPDLRTRVRRLTGINDAVYLPDSEIDATINDVYRELAGFRDWTFLFREQSIAVSDGTDRYALPNYRNFQAVTLDGANDHHSLHEVTPPELAELDPDQDGAPVVFARVSDANGADEIWLWPMPDETFTVTVQGFVEVDDLTGTDEPVWAKEFHGMVAYAAAGRLLAEEGDDSGRFERYEAEARDALSRMEQRYLRSMTQGLFQMGGRKNRSPRVVTSRAH